ncbi:MAG: hypothetical protein NZN28_06390 [Meiothermus sp.]|uniref:hypothetical protein n=1 Tax=Meiothermus sp. TaxID=1955249 RepID=UPI0025CFF60A|nr:hypothetical protein [Meiothermus sp.]MCS7068244.1 hypothetical protein [Meiothermus sp.]
MELPFFAMPFSATSLNCYLAGLAVPDEPPAFNDPAYLVPLALDGWVAVWGLVSRTPSGMETVIYWMDGQGRLGLSNLTARLHWEEIVSRSSLLRSIRPDPGLALPEHAMPTNAERGWPQERLLALARGELQVENPTLALLKP